MRSHCVLLSECESDCSCRFKPFLFIFNFQIYLRIVWSWLSHVLGSSGSGPSFPVFASVLLAFSVAAGAIFGPFFAAWPLFVWVFLLYFCLVGVAIWQVVWLHVAIKGEMATLATVIAGNFWAFPPSVPKGKAMRADSLLKIMDNAAPLAIDC